MLIVNQLRSKFKIHHEDLVPYHAVANKIAEWSKVFYIQHIPCNNNSYTDALAALATSLALQPGTSKEIVVITHDLNCLKSAIEEVPTQIDDIQGKDKL